MIDIIKWIVANVPSEILFVLLFVFFILEYRELKQLRGMIKKIDKDYNEHIDKSVQSNRETLRSRLRKLHLEMQCSVYAGKRIQEQIIEEFYCSFDLYQELGGNGYIKRLKCEVDDWLDDQREKEALK